MTVIGQGEFASGVEWAIEAEGTEDQFSTMLIVRRDGVIVSGSGMAGPKLYDGSLVSASYGITDDQPCTEVIRTHPSVDRVVVVTDRGVRLDVELTQPHQEFGLRFGAVELPADHLPVELLAESGGTEVARQTHGGLRRLDLGAAAEDGVFYGGGPESD